MKATLMGFLCLSFLPNMAAAPKNPAETDHKALFAKHWQISKEFTLAVAEAMPAEGCGNTSDTIVKLSESRPRRA